MIVAFIIFCCWVVSFFFNGIESGLLSIDPVRLRQNVKRRVPAALRLNRLLKHPERLLVTVLFFTNAADILGLLLLTWELVRSFGYAGFFFALLIAFPVYLFLLSVLPKSLYRRFPFHALARLAGVLEFLSILLWPIFEVGARLGRLLLPKGTLSAAERAMIHNVVDFWNIKARDVMVPVPNIVTLQPSASPEEALKLSASSGVDRLPVITWEGQPTGLVNVLDILLERDGAKPLSNYVRRIVLTTEEELAYRIVQRLRAARLGLAAVLDDKKGLRGIVTIEDLIRRLVSSTEAQV